MNTILEANAVEVAAGVHRLTKGVVNWYVVEDAGKLVVVDAGTPGDWGLLVETVGRLGRRLADIDAVLVTHAHADHTGFAEQARTTAGSRVWIHESGAAVADSRPLLPSVFVAALAMATGERSTPSSTAARTGACR